MKVDNFNFDFNKFLVTLLIITSFTLLLMKIEGWGWFLFIAFLLLCD